MTPDDVDTPIADEISRIAQGGVRGGELLEMLPTDALHSVRICLEANVVVAQAQIAATPGGWTSAPHARRRNDALRAFLEVLQVELDGRVE